jgi:hypothetical protein
MEILSGLSDNQAALAMCGAALLSCGFIMSLSYYIGGGRSASDSSTIKTAEPTAEASVPPQRKAA